MKKSIFILFFFVFFSFIAMFLIKPLEIFAANTPTPASSSNPGPPNQVNPVWIYPNEKPDYYNFAKTRLFDDQDLFVLQGTNIFTPVPGLNNFTKTGPNNCGSDPQHPCKVPNKTPITFTITVEYSRDQFISITDPIPPNTTLVGNPSGNFPDVSPTQVVWHLYKETALDYHQYPTPTWRFTITLQPTQDNINITNTVYATIENGPAGTPNPIDKYANQWAICDNEWGFSANSANSNIAQDDFEVQPSGRDYCSSVFGSQEYYCDPTKSGAANPPKLGSPCTRVSNCSCDTSNNYLNNNFTCDNGHQHYNGSCTTNGKLCSANVTTGFPCESLNINNCKCAAIKNYQCTNTDNKIVSGNCTGNNMCDVTAGNLCAAQDHCECNPLGSQNYFCISVNGTKVYDKCPGSQVCAYDTKKIPNTNYLKMYCL